MGTRLCLPHQDDVIRTVGRTKPLERGAENLSKATAMCGTALREQSAVQKSEDYQIEDVWSGKAGREKSRLRPARLPPADLTAFSLNS